MIPYRNLKLYYFPYKRLELQPKLSEAQNTWISTHDYITDAEFVQVFQIYYLSIKKKIDKVFAFALSQKMFRLLKVISNT